MTNITVYDDTYAMLEKLADKTDRTVADIVDELVTDYGEEIE